MCWILPELPQEILEKIVQTLPTTSLGEIACVNRMFHGMTTSRLADSKKENETDELRRMARFVNSLGPDEGEYDIDIF